LLNIFTLMLEAISSSETSVLTRAIRRHIPEDAIQELADSFHPVDGGDTFH
jgi:hypothetical protein